MGEVIHSILHVIMEYIMEEKKPVMVDPEPFIPLTAQEHKNMLIKMYSILATLSVLLVTVSVLK